MKVTIERRPVRGRGSRKQLEDAIGDGPLGDALRSSLLDLARRGGTDHVLDEVSKAARDVPNMQTLTNTLCAMAGTPLMKLAVEIYGQDSSPATYTIELPRRFRPRKPVRVIGIRSAIDAALAYAKSYGYATLVRDERRIAEIGARDVAKIGAA